MDKMAVVYGICTSVPYIKCFSVVLVMMCVRQVSNFVGMCVASIISSKNTLSLEHDKRVAKCHD